MAGESGGKEQNYWPGFVDALSNVVLTLVFVLVVFVFALVITSGKVQQKSAQLVEQKIEQENSARKMLGEIQEQLRKVTAERDKLAAQVTELQAANQRLDAFRRSVEEKERADTPSVIEKRIELTVDAPKKSETTPERADTSSGNVIVITYPRTAVALNERSKAELGKVLDAHRGQLVGVKAELDAFMGSETFSEGRRLAYYRALDLRNFLMDRKIVGAREIEIKTKQDKEPGDARIEIRFVRQ